jgi:hypothetical protein
MMQDVDQDFVNKHDKVGVKRIDDTLFCLPALADVRAATNEHMCDHVRVLDG